MNPLILLAAPFLGAFVSFFIGRKKESYRDLFDVLLTGGVLIGVLLMAPSLKYGPVIRHLPQLMGTGLDLSIGPLQYLMILLTSSIWFLTTVFLTQYMPSRKKRNRFHFFFLLTFGGAMGFFMTDNILNQFTFFEILSMSAYFLIIHDQDNASHEAGTLYITMAIIGGLSALLGILVAYEATGSLMIGEIGRFLAQMDTERRLAGGLLFFGYAIKAGIFPLHIWLPKAYAAAPFPATAILTGILAKTGLFGLFTTVILITGSDSVFGWLAVILGFITLIHGGILALMQRNIKRILAYSSMSQYGLILLGIGIGALSGPDGTTALAGAFIHMISHSLFKVLLFLTIGLLYLKTQELSLNQIHGIGRRTLLLFTTVSIGVLSAWGIPGFTGSISKSLLHHGLSNWAHGLPTWAAVTAEGLFILGSGLTVAYLLKLAAALFLDPPSEFSGMVWLKRRKRASIPMVLLCIMILTTGLFPGSLLDIVRSGLVFRGFTLGSEGAVAAGSAMETAIPLMLGILIHLIITRRFLRSETGGEIEYLNPSLNWFSLEANLYVPVGKVIFIRTTSMISFVDAFLVRLAATFSEWFQAVDTLLLPRESSLDSQVVEQPKALPTMAPLPQSIPKSMPMSKPMPHLKKSKDAIQLLIRGMLVNTSGISFALYLFGAFLVTLLFLLLLR